MTTILMGIALLAAIFKDFILDLVGVGSLPAIGTVITLCISLVITICTFLAGGGRAMRKVAVIMAGTIGEMLFGLNFFPIETITVIILYIMIRKEKKEQAELANIAAQTA